ncbi:ectonucleotide pyrophosphatase/phosphodiesterase [Persicobacter diffluens]|uniref:Alkaline phosphatase family protein n=1 Tax=Persicobacter diffluens TaxID=981 RepID=A0AAN4VV79_9BACT|nr:alkaline phosphatase family protein [Persicobacter diffluens]
MKRLWIFFLTGMVFCSCGKKMQPSTEEAYHPLILISLDGYRFDYTEKYAPPHLAQFSKEGVKAKSMIPSYPSKTFPNHWAVITGMYPGHNGLIHNVFYSPEYDAVYALGKAEERNNPRWYGGTPFWKLVEDQGKKAACFFWPGSDVPQHGTLPSYFFPYDESIPFEKRVEKILSWTQLSKEERPDFITLYFHEPDKSGHNFGPDSEEAAAAVAQVDAQLGALLDGLKQQQVEANIIVVSDHGMQKIEEGIDYRSMTDYSNFEVVNAGGSQVLLYPKEGADVELLEKELTQKADGRFKVIVKESAPERWHYTHTAVPEVWLDAQIPYLFVETGKSFSTGAHGFDPAEQNMHAIFYAKGPSFQNRLEIEVFENIHLYPLMAHLLNLECPETIDGEFEVLAPTLQQP